MGRRRRKGDPALAIGYLRVSTDDQKLSPGAQREALEAWCAQKRVELLAVHQDVGISGAAKLNKRLGLFSAIRELRETGAGVLLVAKVDRIARDVGKAALIADSVARAGGRIVSCDGIGNTQDASGKLFRDMLMAFAEFEKQMISARTAVALQEKRRRGERYCLHAPYGEQFAASGELRESSSEARAVEIIRKSRAQGRTIVEIVEILDARRDCPPRGARWHPTTVYRIIRRLELEAS